jgi:hypothetical protein
MTHLQLTPEQPPAGSAEGDGAAEGEIPAPEADELRQAEARRLEIMERERATDEGMPTPAPADDEDGENLDGEERDGEERDGEEHDVDA